MGFGKAKYDVEEKGLDPRVGHKTLAADGRLDVSQQIVTLTREEAEQKYLDIANKLADLEPKDGVFVAPGLVEESTKEDSEVDGFAPNAETSFVMEKALEEFRAETAVDEEQVKSNQEDIEYVQKILFKDLPQEEPEATPVTPKKAPAKKKTTKK